MNRLPFTLAFIVGGIEVDLLTDIILIVNN